jgi:hypothetical protein
VHSKDFVLCLRFTSTKLIKFKCAGVSDHVRMLNGSPSKKPILLGKLSNSFKLYRNPGFPVYRKPNSCLLEMVGLIAGDRKIRLQLIVLQNHHFKSKDS